MLYSDVPFELSPLHRAADDGDIALIHDLCRQGAFVDLPENEHGLTPLHLATRSAQYDAIRVLLEYGANPNIIDKNGLTCLHIAVDRGDVVVISLFLKAGALIDAEFGEERETPLLWAIRKNHFRAIQILLLASANIKKIFNCIEEWDMMMGQTEHPDKPKIRKLLRCALERQSSLKNLLTWFVAKQEALQDEIGGIPKELQEDIRFLID